MMTDPYRTMLATALVGELNAVLDKIQIIMDNDASKFLDKRLDLKQARAQLDVIISKVEPSTEEIKTQLTKVKKINAINHR